MEWNRIFKSGKNTGKALQFLQADVITEEGLLAKVKFHNSRVKVGHGSVFLFHQESFGGRSNICLQNMLFENRVYINWKVKQVIYITTSICSYSEKCTSCSYSGSTNSSISSINLVLTVIVW